MKTFIRNATVLTVDERFRIIRDGAVGIEDDRIVDVGRTVDLADKYGDAGMTIEGRGHTLLPGFVSSHNHLGYTVFRGRAEDVGNKPTPSLFLPMKRILRRDERAVFGALGAGELLCGGVTTVLQMEEDTDVILPFLERCGIRAGVAVMTNDVDIEKLALGETVFNDGERLRQLRETEELIQTWRGRGDGRITPFVAANMALSCSPHLLRGLRDIAERQNVRLSYHVGLGAYEVELVQKLHGMRPFAFARKVGFLEPDVIVAHCHYMSESDMDILAQSGAHVAHCPVLNSLRGASAPIWELLGLGVNITLGIDNYFADHFDVMRACIAVGRIRTGDATFLSACEVLRFATMGAARALGLDREVGSIEPGKKADLQLVDMRRVGITPVTDPVSTLVYHAHANDVRTVLVDGKLVVKDGRPLTFDEAALIAEAQAASDAVWARFEKRYGLPPAREVCKA